MLINREKATLYEEINAYFFKSIIQVIQKRHPEKRSAFMKVNGGWATYDGFKLWNSQILNWGGESEVTEAEFKAVLSFYDSHPCNVRIELPSLGDETLPVRLEEEGFRIREFGLTAGRELSKEDAKFIQSSDFEVREAKPDEDLIWSNALNMGFSNKDTDDVPEGLTAIGKACFYCEDLVNFVAYDNEKIAGVASLGIRDDIAVLFQATTLEPFRCRGAQTDLIRIRMAHAAKLGAKYIVIKVEPGTRSLFNAQRNGFETLFSSILMSRDPLEWWWK